MMPSAPYQRRCQHVIRFGNDLEPPAAAPEICAELSSRRGEGLRGTPVPSPAVFPLKYLASGGQPCRAVPWGGYSHL